MAQCLRGSPISACRRRLCIRIRFSVVNSGAELSAVSHRCSSLDGRKLSRDPIAATTHGQVGRFSGSLGSRCVAALCNRNGQTCEYKERKKPGLRAGYGKELEARLGE